MKQTLLTFLGFWMAFQNIISLTPASLANSPLDGTPAVLCLPGVYLVAANCDPAGPSEVLTGLAQQGVLFPLSPVPGARPDPQLKSLPFAYARLDEPANPIYSNLDDAIAGNNPVQEIAKGRLKFISYIGTASPGGSPKPEAFNLTDGTWMSSASVASRWGALPTFQGRTFSEPFLGAFGWVNAINASIETKRTPGFQEKDYTGHILYQYQAVRVYSSKKMGDEDWYLVGPEEWVEGRFIGRVLPNPTPPKGVTNGRWIEVNLDEQTLMVYDDSQLVFATLIASGLDPFWTRPGLFQIQKKLASTVMSGAFEADRSDYYYLEDVPWTMYYDEARALHGAYWRTRFGFPQSHGCVNLSPGDAHWLFNWAKTGDWVYVWDPSGKTPTDPKYYAQGGA